MHNTIRRIMLYFFILLFLPSIANATNYCASSNIVNCYTMYEGKGTTLIDKSTNGNNGTFASSNNPSWSQTVPNRTYTEYSLNYTSGSQWVTIPNTTWTKSGQAQSITYWFYPTSNTNVRLWDRGGHASSLSTSPAWAISMSIVCATTNLTVISSLNTITQNAWNHIAMTWDGSTTATNLHIYINGTETTYNTQQNCVGGITDLTASTLYLGNRSAGDRNLQGNITDVAFFNKVLTATEVADIYYHGIGALNKSNIRNATVNNATIN